MIPNQPKGDPRISAELEHARFRNRSGDNPNLAKPLIFWDFESGKVCVEEQKDDAA